MSVESSCSLRVSKVGNQQPVQEAAACAQIVLLQAGSVSTFDPHALSVIASAVKSAHSAPPSQPLFVGLGSLPSSDAQSRIGGLH